LVQLPDYWLHPDPAVAVLFYNYACLETTCANLKLEATPDSDTFIYRISRLDYGLYTIAVCDAQVTIDEIALKY